MLEHRAETRAGGVVVRVAGEIDLDSAPRLADALTACLQTRPRRVTVDLSEVVFCDCSGLNVLLTAGAGGQGALLTVVGVREPIVALVVELTGSGPALGMSR